VQDVLLNSAEAASLSQLLQLLFFTGQQIELELTVTLPLA